MERTRKQADLTTAGLRSGSANTRAHLLLEPLTKVKLRADRIEIDQNPTGLWEKLELERGHRPAAQIANSDHSISSYPQGPSAGACGAWSRAN
jgi:hypothetical protein